MRKELRFYIKAAREQFIFAKQAIAKQAHLDHIANAWRFIRIASTLSGIDEDRIRDKVGDV